MRRREWTAATILVLSMGCGKGKETTPESPAKETADAHDHGGHDDDGHDEPGHGEHESGAGEAAATVRIAPEMLRDLRVTTRAAESRQGGEGIPILGELHVDQERYAEVGPPLPARVTRVLVAAGAAVREGAPLVELSSQEIGRARSDYAAARARVDVARRAVERKRGLAVERIAPAREVQEAEADLAAWEAAAAASRGALAALGVDHTDLEADDGARLVLRSPLGGTVIERSAVVGQVSDPAKPLFRVGDLSRLWLVVHGFERDAVRVAVGTPARVSLAALPGRTFTGEVVLVGREVEPRSRTIPIRIRLGNEEGQLRPGMSATAWLPVGSDAASLTSVPVASLQRLDDQWVVFLATAEEGVFERRVVGRGRDLGGEVEVVSGLAPGERVVVEGAFLLKAEAEKARGAGEHNHH